MSSESTISSDKSSSLSKIIKSKPLLTLWDAFENLKFDDFSVNYLAWQDTPLALNAFQTIPHFSVTLKHLSCCVEAKHKACTYHLYQFSKYWTCSLHLIKVSNCKQACFDKF